MKPHSLRDRAEYALTRTAELALVGLPDRAARTLGLVLGQLARAPLGIRRETVESNIRRAFPDADPGWIERVVRETYAHLAREAVSMIRLSHMTPAEILNITEIQSSDWERLQGALAHGRGVLLVTGHFGNWEVAAAAVAARGVPIDAIVKRQRNRLVDAQVNAARARMGVGVIEMSRAPKEVLRSLARNHVIGIVGDQDARRAGVFVPFFGVPSSTYRGPAMFALRFNVPILASVAQRLPDGRYRVMGETIPAEPTGDLESDIRRVTAAVSSYLEARIREEPGQYFWFHKRWKTAPEEELTSASRGISHAPRATPEGPHGDLTDENGESA